MAGCSISRNAQDLGLLVLGGIGCATTAYNMLLVPQIQRQQADFESCCVRDCMDLFKNVMECSELKAAIGTNNDWSQCLFVVAAASGSIITTALAFRSFWGARPHAP